MTQIRLGLIDNHGLVYTILGLCNWQKVLQKSDERKSANYLHSSSQLTTSLANRDHAK